jgi:hypothetical protein
MGSDIRSESIVLAVGVGAALSSAHARAWALGPDELGADALRPGADAVVDEVVWKAPRPANGYWSVGVPRWFVSSKTDVGSIYAKPYFSVGYGLPHWIWVGADVNAITTLEFAQVYGGARASSPILDLAFGVRDTYSYGKPFLTPRATFVAADLDRPGRNARYWAWEAEGVAVAPLPHSAILLNYIAVGTIDVPANRYVYDESYRLIVAPSFFQVFRGAIVLRLLREDALRIGVLGGFITSTGRSRGVVRVGPAGALQVTDHLEMLGTLTVAVSSPDRLGLALGAYGVAGLRYRWATGEHAPKWPWVGLRVP